MSLMYISVQGDFKRCTNIPVLHLPWGIKSQTVHHNKHSPVHYQLDLGSEVVFNFDTIVVTLWLWLS